MIEPTSLGAGYFDDIFAGDEDPWDLASSAYEAAKFAKTHEALADRRYSRALEVGCAHGVLTGRLLDLCDTLLAIDISGQALAKARLRLGDRAGLALAHMAFPQEKPDGPPFDLVVLSEVAYYWGPSDLDRASSWLKAYVVTGGRVILVHYTGETDYPQSGDGAVETLWTDLEQNFSKARTERHDGYRLDLWERR